MHILTHCALLLCFGISTVTPLTFDNNALTNRLSRQASISGPNSAPRWSEFDAPAPIAVVNVASELDVLLTVRYHGPFGDKDSAC